MQEPIKVTIYGDSLMKGTVIDDKQRYHATISDFLLRLAGRFGLDFCNRAKFGVTIGRGCRLLERDLEKGLNGQYALLEYGGNDCSFHWDQVAEDPTANHRPFTEPEVFQQTLTGMVGSLCAAKVQPVLMTLPPIDAERHLAFVGKTEAAQANILRWLGDVQMIYRFHELYSNIIAQVARQTGALLVDVRQRFLDRHDLRRLVGIDGVHLSREGYKEVTGAFDDFIAARRRPAPA